MLNKKPIIIPPVCRGVYAKYYALRFSSANPCDWMRLSYLDKFSKWF
jgi:hypothetical protein